METRGDKIIKILKEKLMEVYFDSYDIELQPEEAEEIYIDDTAGELFKEIDKVYWDYYKKEIN